MKKIAACVALSLILGPLPWARAEVAVKDVQWGFRQRAKASVRFGNFQEYDRWFQPPAGKVSVMPRVLVTLVNRGPAPGEGVVLRYAVSARIVSVKTPGGRGTWVVPMWVERRRGLFLKPNQLLKVQIDPTGELRLATSMKEMFRAGFWPDALNIQVMVEPRLGEDIVQKIFEKTLPVVWQPAGQ